MRSSNCPRYFVPATIEVISRRRMRLLKSKGDVCRLAICCAKPSAMALFPTPGSPISIGLFFFRRHNTSVTRCISLVRPTTGSSLPSNAAFVKSVENLSSTGVPVLPLVRLISAVPADEELSPRRLFRPVIFSSSSSDSPMPSTVVLEFGFSRYFIANS